MNKTCVKCGYTDQGNFCSQCGAPLEEGRAAHRLGKILFGPVFDYFQYTKSMLEPKVLVADIQSGKFDGYNLLSFLVGAVAISTFIEYFFPSQALFSNMPPIVGEVIVAFVVMLLTGVFNAPLHYYFNRNGRNVSFKKFFIATAAITALFYPWLTLINGSLEFFGVKNPEKNTSYASLYFFAQTYCLLYSRTQGQVAIGIGGYIIGLLVVVVGAILAFN